MPDFKKELRLTGPFWGWDPVNVKEKSGNIMNIGIMWGIKKYLIDEDKIREKIESNKKKIKKKSRFQQRLEDVAKQQQKKRR